MQNHKKMIWCKKCLITAFCSAECKANSAEAHAQVCEHFAAANRKIGLGRVCFYCGTPEAAGTTSLKRCDRCEAAFYCSKECQTRHWRAGHKLDCVQVQGSLGAGARFSSSHRPASDSVARADQQVAAQQQSLDAKHADMVRQFERMKASGCTNVDRLGVDDDDSLVMASAMIRVVSAQEELETTGMVIHELSIGSKVIVHSLTGATQHNLNRGDVISLPGEGEDRYGVRMEGSHESIRVRGRNLCDVTDLHQAVGRAIAVQCYPTAVPGPSDH